MEHTEGTGRYSSIREQTMSIPKNQHYIPQMLSKRFTDQEGKLYVFDKSQPNKSIQKKDPRKTFVRRHLYTQLEEDGTRDASVESEFLAPLESDANPVIEKIVCAARREQLPNLSSDEKDIWVKFFYILFARVPDRIYKASYMVRQMVLERIDIVSRSRPLNDLERSVRDNPETMNRHLKNGSVQNLLMSPSGEVSEFLAETRIVVVVIDKPNSERSFVIGSNPVVGLSYPEGSHIADPNATVWLPLASDVAVSSCPGKSDKVVSANDRHIRAINKGIFQQSTVIAGCSRELIESLLSEEARNFGAITET